MAALCAPTFFAPPKRSLHGRFQQKVFPSFHRLCLVLRSSGHLSLPSCMPMAPLTLELSFVFHFALPFLPFLPALFRFLDPVFWSSLDPKAKHRGATGHPALALPSPTLRSYFPDVSLRQLQRCFCLIFFRLKKAIPKESLNEGIPRLVPSPLCLPLPIVIPPHPFASVSASHCSFFIHNSSRF